MDDKITKRLKHAKRQYLLKINDTSVAILVDDNDEDIVVGCFEASSNGLPKMAEGETSVPISLKPIKDETVLGYAHFISIGILDAIKQEHNKRI